MLAEAQAIAANTPGYDSRAVHTLPEARRSVTRVVSLSLGLGLVGIVFAVAGVGDPIIFGFLAVIAAILAYLVALLSLRLRFLRTRSNRVLAILGVVFASCAICVVVATAVLGWHVDFSNGASAQNGQDANRQIANGGGAADDARTHADELALLKRVTAAWEAPHSRIGTWPSSAGTKNGSIVSSYGSTGIRLPAGWTFTYTPSPDLFGYTATIVNGSGVGEMFDQEHGLYEPTS
jgi:predicted PurR-regulated permease PerM